MSQNLNFKVMSQGEREFRMQEQFGRAFEAEDFILFQILVHFPESVVRS